MKTLITNSATLLRERLAKLLGVSAKSIPVTPDSYKYHKAGKSHAAVRFVLPVRVATSVIPLRVYFFQVDGLLFLTDSVSFTEKSDSIDLLIEKLKTHINTLKSLQ